LEAGSCAGGSHCEGCFTVKTGALKLKNEKWKFEI